MELFQTLQTLVSIIKWIIAIGVIVVIIIIASRARRKFNQKRIIDRWSILIDGANGDGEKIITGLIREIERVEASNIHVTRKEVKPGKGFIKNPREFLVAEHRLFDTYDMYIGARDYGKQLFVSWYLVAEPISLLRLFKRDPLGAILKLPFILLAKGFSQAQGGSGELFSALNLFDTEELTAYVTTVHHALLETVKELMEDRHIDFTKIDRKTSGFLNLS